VATATSRLATGVRRRREGAARTVGGSSCGRIRTRSGIKRRRKIGRKRGKRSGRKRRRKMGRKGGKRRKRRRERKETTIEQN